MNNKAIISFLVFISFFAMAYSDVIFSEDFEGNWEDDWYTDFGTWEVGTPSGGSVSAYDGNNCLATILNGLYPPNAATRFIKIGSIQIAQANQYPRLTFWEWFSFNEHAECRDQGKVLIKPSGSPDWIQLGESKIRNSSLVWAYTAYDLAAYAGQTVQFAFELDVADTYGGWGDEDLGWYIDNLEIKTGTPVFNNPETWESGIGDWYVDSGTWEVGVPTSGPGTAYQGSKCIATKLSGTYYPNAISKMICPQYTVPMASQYPRLTFWEWFSFNEHAECRDHGKVLIKPSGSPDWIQLGENKIRNSSLVWAYTVYDLAAYAGQTVQFAFELDVADTYGGWGDEDLGWYIDNLEIKTGTPVFNNPETWESGIGDWYVDSGTWEVGVPTSGPGTAYQGSKCLGTKLSGAYYPNAISKMICPQYTVPMASQYPRLTFWEWFSFNEHAECRDHGKVLIKPSGSPDWIQLGENKIRNSSLTWAYTVYDLAAYAGQIVQFAFELDVADTYGGWGDEGLGWYIDNLEIKTGTPVFNNPETWESGIGDWYVDSGTWEVGVPTSGPNASYQGTKCVGTSLAGNYYPNVETRLVSPAFLIPTDATNLALRYRNWYDIAANDTVFAQIKTVGDTVWYNLSGAAYTGNGGGVWSYTYIPMQSYAGQTVQIAFYLDSDGGSSSGWYIDNVLISYTTATPPAPVATSATNITQTSFQANWNASTGATSYRLDVSLNSSFSSFVSGYDNITVSGLNQSVTGLTAGTKYYYRLRAANATATSGNSGTVTVLTIAPNPVTTSATSITNASFQANWSNSLSATGYRLDVSANSNFSTNLSGFNNLAVVGTNLSVTGLSAGTAYYYRLRAVNASGISGNSNVISLTTLLPPPKTPQNLSIHMNGNTAMLSWDAVTETILNTPIVPDYYLIFISPNCSETSFAYLASTQDLQYSHILVGGFSSRMFYRIYAFKDSGRGEYELPQLKPGLSVEEVFKVLNK